MKIAITADPGIPVPPQLYGGIERIIYLLVCRLTAMGHEITLFAHKDSAVPCELVPYKFITTGRRSLINNTILINKVLFKQKFDLIHSFGRLAYLLPQIPRTIPKLMSYQREPTIGQVKKAVRLSAANTLFFSGCSNYISDQIKPYGNTFTVHNGVDMSSYTLKNTVAEDAPLIFLGRIEQVKGTHTAIEIAKKARKKLIIAGNIPASELSYFNENVKPFLDKDIVYVGPVNDVQKNELLGSASALLMPIHWNEPFGIVMIEAMACGTPVIGFPKGAVPEVVEDGVSGFIVNNTEEALRKIGHLNEIERSGVRLYAERKFNFNMIVEQYLDLYRKLINYG